jgi:hypothetical protein
MPKTVNITLRNLLTAINGTTMFKIFDLANMSHILDRNEPYTVFVPTEQALEEYNLPHDREKVARIVRMHIIAGELADLKDGEQRPTLLSDEVQVVVRKDMSDNYFVGIKGTLRFEKRAKVLGAGQATSGGVVYSIDNVLEPHSVNFGLAVYVVQVLLQISVVSLVVGVVAWQGWLSFRGTPSERQPLLSAETDDEPADAADTVETGTDDIERR